MVESSRERWPLTSAQRGIWFAQQLDPANPVYNTGESIAFHGPFDRVRFEAALRQAIGESQALHAHFVQENGEVWQTFTPSDDWPLDVFDMRNQPEPHHQAEAWMRMHLAQPIDLTCDRLFSQALFQIADDHWLWFQRIHHIAIDAFGLALIAQRVAELYTTNSGRPFAPFVQVIEEHHRYQTSPERQRDRAYWLEQFGDDHQAPTLAGTYASSSATVIRQTAMLDAHDLERLRELAQSAKANWSELVLAGIAVYLQRMTGRQEMVLGFPIMGRIGTAALRVPAIAVNVLPLRLRVQPNASMLALVEHIKDQIRAAVRHQRYRYEDLIRDLKLVGSTTPLFGPLINILPFDQQLHFAEATASIHNLAAGPIDDLSFGLLNRANQRGLQIDCDANPALYSAEQLTTHLQRLIALLTSIAQLPDLDLPIAQLNILRAEERQQVLFGWNQTAHPVPASTIPALLEAQAARTPHAIAAVCGAEQLTFAALNIRANQLARALIARGAGPEQIVALMLPRSLDYLVALFAVLKTGAAYVPLDPQHPRERLITILDDAQPVCAIASGELAARLPISTMRRLVLDTPETAVLLRVYPHRDICDSERITSLQPQNTAYIMYTSGSTGVPKGVAIEHASLVNLFACHLAERIEPARHDQPLRLAHMTPFTFDASWDPLLWMLGGNELHLIDDETMRDAEALLVYLRHKQIDYLDTTPSYLQQLVSMGLFEQTPHQPRLIVAGGEMMPPNLWRDLAARSERSCFNMYGPTEATVDAYAWCTTSNGDSGSPIWNSHIYLLDSSLQPVASGVVGDLYIGGAALARGYFNRPARTAECFVANPFGAPGSRMYRTGDLARWGSDGLLQIVGRADEQIKLRGFRIELGEIVVVLEAHPQVTQALVIVRDDHNGNQQLIAYYRGSIQETALRDHARTHLPEYMVPRAWLQLAHFPLTSNGKIDLAALPAPQTPVQPEQRGPRNEREKALCQLFARVLGHSDIGIDDNFFDCGGHSLLAARLVAEARTQLGLQFSIGQIFAHATVAQLAAIDQHEHTPELRRQARPAVLPLSFAQRRLWFLHKLEGPGPTYNLPLALRLSGPLNIAALETALNDLLARHESLRTVIHETDGIPQQTILATAHLNLTVSATTPAQLENDLRNAGRYGFDLAGDLPIRATLFSLGSNEYVLLLLLHHSAGDGWSLGPLATDLAAAYRARLAGHLPPWSPLAVQYADYTLWQRLLLGDEQHLTAYGAQQLHFWRTALAGLPDLLELPFDYPRPAVASYRGDAVPVSLSATLHRQLIALARESGATVFMALQAAFAALLSRIGAGTDIPIGAPVAGRTHAALDSLIGFFVNTLVLRTDTSANPSFRELLTRVQVGDAQAFANQDVPFDQLVEALKPPRSLTRHPLFQVMLAFQQASDEPLDMPDLVARLAPFHVGTAKFDLLLNLNEHHAADGSPNGISGFLEYSTDLFAHATAEALAVRFTHLLTAAIATPDQPIGALDILLPAEKQQLLDWNRTSHDLVPETLPGAFEQQAARTPRAIAVLFEQQRLTYSQFNARANQLAHWLIAQGIGPEQIVAVAIPRSFELLVALYAVHKAGAAYLPLDPDYPTDRISFMLEDAQPACVLTSGAIATMLPPITVPMLLLDVPETNRMLAVWPSSNPTDEQRTTPLLAQHPAYVIYTSGSTGRPKGVIVAHEGIINRLRWMQAKYQLGEDDRILQKTPSSFDVSVWEFFWPLLEGATLVVARPDGHKDPVYLANLIQATHITTIHFVPSMLHIFLEEPRAARCRSLRQVMCSGEALPAEVASQFHRTLKAELHNLYGPTEASVDVTYWPCTPDSNEHSVPIGFPVWNTSLRILDHQLQAVPPGVVGELYLAGVQLARGYLGHPTLTAERFVADPFGPPGSRMYRTGDLARWRTDGAVEYVGRSDQQVKLRGFRIELGEIETLLMQHSDVAQAAVIAREDRPGDKRLVAYIVPTALAQYDPVRLRRHLAEALPEYMVPSAFVPLATLPLSPNGKLERASFPAPEQTIANSDRPPRTPQEAALRDLFAEILGLRHVGIDDNFFDLGGHSLLVVQLISRIRETLGAELSIGSLFQAPTVAGLAELLELGTSVDALGVLLPIRASGERTPLFCFHPAGGLSWCYTGLMRQLGPQQPIYGVQARGVSNEEALPTTFEALIADYVAHLRAVQPNGPYHLLGWSTGGIIAQAVATHLQKQGASVGVLAILDAYPAALMRDLPASDEIEALEALLIMAGYSLDIMGDLPVTFEHVTEVLMRKGSPLASLDPSTIMRLKTIYLNTNAIVRAFDHQRFDGNLLFFRAMVETADEQLTAETWRPFIAGQIHTYEIQCSHKDLTQVGPLAEIGAVIATALTQEHTHVASL